MNKYREHAKAARAARFRERSCARKVGFDTREAAFQKGQKVYACGLCGKWHRSGSVAKLAAKLRARSARGG